MKIRNTKNGKYLVPSLSNPTPTCHALKHQSPHRRKEYKNRS